MGNGCSWTAPWSSLLAWWLPLRDVRGQFQLARTHLWSNFNSCSSTPNKVFLQGLQQISFSLKVSNAFTSTMATTSKWGRHLTFAEAQPLIMYRLNVLLVVAITWIFRQLPKKYSTVSFTSLGVMWRVAEQQTEEARSWTTTPIFVTMSGSTRCFPFYLYSPILYSWTFPPPLPSSKFFHADSGKGLGASHQTGWWVAFHICG